MSNNYKNSLHISIVKIQYHLFSDRSKRLLLFDETLEYNK